MKQRNRDQQKPVEQNLTKKLSLEETSAGSQTSFSDHIAELRRRIFFVLLAFLVASSLAYNYRDNILGIIMQPLDGEKLIYLTPGGGFNFIFQVSMYAGLLAAAPVLIYQLYGFIRPALPKRAQRSSVIVVLVAFLLMLCGVAFGYFVAVPSALHFLSTFAGGDVTPNLTADSYLSFFLAYIAGLGILFELPLLLLFLHWIHPMTPGKLLKSERFVILFAFVAAALITPTPDMLNQAMIAIPLILIYQLGVIAVLLVIRRDHRKARLQQKQVRVKVDIASLPELKVEPITPVRRPSAPQAAQAKLRSVPQKKTIDGFSRPPGTLRPRPRQTSVVPPSRPPSTTPPQRPTYQRSLSVDGFPLR
jgi:sec-independent protein translocase protein TatC